MITLDTSGVLALLDSKDPDHPACFDVMQRDPGPYLVPVAVLSEIGWFLQTRFPPQAEEALLDDFRQGAYMLDWHPSDIARIQALALKYRDLPLGIADASVVACAERRGGRVLTTDHRHFPIVARGEGSIVPLPLL